MRWPALTSAEKVVCQHFDCLGYISLTSLRIRVLRAGEEPSGSFREADASTDFREWPGYTITFPPCDGQIRHRLLF